MKITLDYELARAIATDAANRNMRKNGRKKWSERDYMIAVSTLNELYPVNDELKEYVPQVK